MTVVGCTWVLGSNPALSVCRRLRFSRRSGRRIAAVPVKFRDAPQKPAPVLCHGIVTEDRWTFQIEDAKGGKIVLNQ
jgi:hypothetical protein